MSNSVSNRSFNSGLAFARQPVATGLIAGLFSRITEWRDRRAAAAELFALTDRELADIGVSRHQIPQVVARAR